MRTLVPLLALLVLAPTADAQFGRVLDRAKRAAEEAVDGAVNGRQASEPEAQAPPTSTPASPRPTAEAAQAVTAQSAAPADAPMPPTGPFPTTATGQRPAIDLHNWLHRVAYVHAEQDGPTVEVRPFGSQVLFPVEGVTYQNVLRRADGSVVIWEEVELETDPEFPAFGTLKGARTYGLQVDLEAGAYRASVTANGHEIGALPFEIVQTTAGDGLYDTRSVFSVRGPWTDLAVLVLDEGLSRREWADPMDSPVSLRFWLPPSLHGEQGGRHRATLYRGSTVLNDDDDRATFPSPGYGWWLRSVAFSVPLGSGETLRERLTPDGDYRIEIAEEGRAPIRVYRFRVEGGTPVAHPRSALDTTPRADFLTPQSFSAMGVSATGGPPDRQERPGALLWLTPD